MACRARPLGLLRRGAVSRLALDWADRFPVAVEIVKEGHPAAPVQERLPGAFLAARQDVLAGLGPVEKEVSARWRAPQLAWNPRAPQPDDALLARLAAGQSHCLEPADELGRHQGA